MPGHWNRKYTEITVSPPPPPGPPFTLPGEYKDDHPPSTFILQTQPSDREAVSSLQKGT